MHKKFDGGNRLAVPSSVDGNHFFYKARHLDFDAADIATLVEATKKYVSFYGIEGGDISVVNGKALETHQAGAAKAFENIIARFGLVEQATGDAGVLFCEWAPPHTDPSYSGKAFLSLILHTGTEPYIMQTFHTKVEKGILSLETSTRALKVGDIMIFDPTTPHIVNTAHPHSDQLLIAFQFILDDSTIKKRAEILAQFPPIESDKDCVEGFNNSYEC